MNLTRNCRFHGRFQTGHPIYFGEQIPGMAPHRTTSLPYAVTGQTPFQMGGVNRVGQRIPFISYHKLVALPYGGPLSARCVVPQRLLRLRPILEPSVKEAIEK